MADLAQAGWTALFLKRVWITASIPTAWFQAAIQVIPLRVFKSFAFRTDRDGLHLPRMPKTSSTSEKPIRLVLIEDHADFRESVSMVLEERGGYQCVGGFSTMEDAIDAFRGGLETDLVLSDLGLPGMSGIAGIRKIRELLPDARVLVLTAFTDKAKVFAALEAGAHGYLVKAGSASRLMDTLEEVLAGGTPLDPKIAGMILQTFRQLSPIPEAEA
ncbi:MAG: response regulator transcription factor, partial [Verrucomicrobiaceae bacterium]